MTPFHLVRDEIEGDIRGARVGRELGKVAGADQKREPDREEMEISQGR